MVARVDKALKDDLDISDGLAAENVYVLDPCCGTGAYLTEVLRRIAANLERRGLGALTGARVKQAAMERVFGFEIMPAPFVVSHLQVGITMQDLDAPLAEDGVERPGVFLTNALTGWEPKTTKPLPFPELEEERDRAERVKQETPILVILGNPPYNGFAGMAVEEERELSEAYRTTKRVRRPEGQGLNDLYVRFFRMAERRIVEKTGRGVVCFISNYSWLDGLSFTGMRERYLEAFDAVRVDNLNGDKYKTGKVAPDGTSDPSIFSTPGDPVGIQVGTAITTLVRKADHAPAGEVGFRHLWGQTKCAELMATAEEAPGTLYEGVEPVLPLGLPFVQTAVSEGWFDWPSLPDLFPISFPGVKTSRDGFLVDVDLDRLKARIADYFNTDVSHEEIARRYPSVMKTTARFDARAIRDALLARGGPTEDGFVRFTYRPFDNRWLYWEADTKLLDEKRADYRPHVFEGNVWLSAAQHRRKGAEEPQSCFTKHMGSLHLIERGALMFPVRLRNDGIGGNDTKRCPNLSGAAQRYLERSRRERGRSVPPRPRNPPRSHLPQGERRGTAHGMAAHSATRLAGRCGRGRGGGARRVSGAGSGSRPAARSGDARPGCHARRIAAGDCRNRRTHNDGRTQHDRRRFFGDGRMGTLRNWRRRDAWPRPGCRASLHAGGAGRFGRDSCHSRRDDVRRVSQCPRLLAQRPCFRLALQTGRLPGSQEMALLP